MINGRSIMAKGLGYIAQCPRHKRAIIMQLLALNERLPSSYLVSPHLAIFARISLARAVGIAGCKLPALDLSRAAGR